MLPPCPVCSQPPQAGFVGVVDRPAWFPAPRTSRARGVRCYIWGGCAHARELVPVRTAVSAEDTGATEAAWDALRRRLFAQRTERWTEAQRETLARFVGLAPSENFAPSHPAADSNQQRKDENERKSGDV